MSEFVRAIYSDRLFVGLGLGAGLRGKGWEESRCGVWVCGNEWHRYLWILQISADNAGLPFLGICRIAIKVGWVVVEFIVSHGVERVGESEWREIEVDRGR